ncbi:hypothetical protein M885DRAFT_517720 [Pelagophyceae sp. CCMP2097]|nr:hypothetical protein M885DRAFT_517720 [Pelagophyceae sp. CCMP2097]
MLGGEYTWKETAAAVHVRVQLKGCSAKAVDVFAADVYCKISYPPRLIELDLLHPVDEDAAQAKIKDGVLTLTLPKKQPETWGALVCGKGTLTKAEVSSRRLEATARRRSREAEITANARQRKTDDERVALRTQMALESDERGAIDDKKADEKSRAEEDVYATFKDLKTQEAQREAEAKKRDAEAKKRDADENMTLEEEWAASQRAAGVVDDVVGIDAAPVVDETPPAAAEPPPPPRALPPPRSQRQNVVSVTHTPRVFPTPMRESKLVEENQWVAKHRAHLHKNGMLFGRKTDSRGIEEADPTWLKARGDELFAGADFASAVEAYTAALELDAGWVNCLANRAACELKLGRFDDCVNDCTDALAALTDASKHFEPKLLARRAAARSGAADFSGAARDLDAAAKCASGDDAQTALRADADRMRSLALAAMAKADADALLGAGDAAAAAAKYSEALSREPSFVSALANRAAAYLALDDARGAVADCTAALRIFEFDDEAAGPLPPHGSEKRRGWVLRTLARRGAAYAKLGDVTEAIRDYEAATVIAPDDAALRADLGALQKLASADDAPAA